MCEWKQKERWVEMVNDREREKQVGKLFVCLPTKTIHQGFLENPLLTCTALTFISKFLRASDQADLFILKFCNDVMMMIFLQVLYMCFDMLVNIKRVLYIQVFFKM